jgi:opacity protein-like surface antigen
MPKQEKKGEEMKRIIPAVLFLLFMSFSMGHSQLIRGYGIKAGVAFANQDWRYDASGSLNTDRRKGVDVGAFVEWLDIPFLSVVTEAHYIQKGFSENIAVTSEEYPDGTGQVVTHTPELDYLSIPVLAKMRYDFLNISLYGFAGPRYDILVSTKSDVFGAVLDNIKSSELGATLGLGIDCSLPALFKIGAEIRYSPDIQNIYSKNILTVKNRSWEMLVVVTL